MFHSLSASPSPIPSPPRLRLSRASHLCGGMNQPAKLIDWLTRRGEADAASALRRLSLPPSCRVSWTAAGRSLKLEVRHVLR